jgi:hypothetical protein
MMEVCRCDGLQKSMSASRAKLIGCARDMPEGNQRNAGIVGYCEMMNFEEEPGRVGFEV